MSYQGYEQHICANGHRFDTDCNYSDVNDPCCPYCQSQSVWYNAVDETNCHSYGIIPPAEWEKLKLSEDVSEVCNLGHNHIVARETYRIPTKEELKSIRYYFETDDAGQSNLKRI